MASVTDQGRASRESLLVVPANDRAAIVVSGNDRTSWLNGLVTSDLAKLAPGHASYGLLVEKKGRIQTDMANMLSNFFDLGTFPASVKAALDLLGRPGGRTRDPIRPLTAEQREKLRRAMESAGLIEPVRAVAGGKA